MQVNVKMAVAPYVGAWIETFEVKDVEFETKSHPMWVRGLKLQGQCPCQLSRPVAPYVGAWIETLVLSPGRQ